MANKYTTPLANDSGMHPLDAIKQLESSGGTNPAARKPNKYGALGNYQITPALYTDIQAHYPQFKDVPFERAALEEGLDRQVANAGLDVIEKQLTSLGVDPTYPNIALAYHSGVGNVKKGKIGSQGLQYVTKFKQLTGLN
jgi:hypothetical protein